MVLYVDVLRAIVEHWVLRKRDAVLVIGIDDHWTLHRDTQILQEIRYLNRLLRRLAERHVLSFRRRQSNT